MKNKKCFWVIIISAIFVLTVTSTLFISFNFISKNSGSFTSYNACVIENDQTRLLIYFKDSKDNSRLCYIHTKDAKITRSDGRSIIVDEIETSQMIQFTTDGITNLLYPETFTTVKTIKLLGEINDNLYQEGMNENQKRLNYKTPS